VGCGGRGNGIGSLWRARCALLEARSLRAVRREVECSRSMQDAWAAQGQVPKRRLLIQTSNQDGSATRKEPRAAPLSRVGDEPVDPLPIGRHARVSDDESIRDVPCDSDCAGRRGEGAP
jgi:hypothetical protein